MVRKSPLSLFLALALLCLLLPAGRNAVAQPQGVLGQKMVFSWTYAENLSPVDYWQIMVKRVVGDHVSYDAVTRTYIQEYEVSGIYVGVRISIKVRGVNSGGYGPWSPWSIEHMRELPLPPDELPDD